MLGYIYNTIQEVQQAQLLCDTFYGYPKENSVTQHWVDFDYNEEGNYYFIIFDESISEILGEPITL